MSFQTVYCTYNNLEEAFCFKEEEPQYKALYNLCYHYSDVIIDLPDDEIKLRLLKDPLIKAFIKREHSEFHGLPRFFTDLKEERLETYPNDFIICEEVDDFCEKTFEEKGVFISNTNLLPKLFKTLQNHSFEKSLNLNDDSHTHNYYSWENLLKENVLSPCNCAVIVDNYLFEKYNSFKNENLFSIVKHLIPDRLDVPFHLTLVTDNREAKQDKNFFSKTLIPELYDHIKSTTGKEIQIEVVTHSMNPQIHQRAILLSHFLISSEKGFNIFIDGIVKSETVYYSDWNYFKIEKFNEGFKGDLKIDRNRNYLNVIRKQIEKSREGKDFAGRQDFWVSNIETSTNRIFS